ncbi:MAG TPA: cyclase family protein [Terriglobales bacterium]|nr:cyclase family protein [Terriglobales bacterium]
MHRFSLLTIVFSILIPSAVSAAGGDKLQIIDLTDTIRVGLVEQTAGRAMIEKYGIHEVSMEPEMNFKVTTGRSTFLGISTQVGTHVDAGAHVEPDGWPVDQIDLDRMMGPGVLVDERAKTADDPVTPADLERQSIHEGDIVVFYFNYHPPKDGELYSQSYLTDETARWLVKHKVRAIASNTPGVENFKRGVAQHWTEPQNQAVAWPVHKILLSHRIPIIEGLTNLDQLLGRRFQFIALPLKIAGADGSPIRAVAVLR